MKKVLSFLFAICLMLSISTTAFASETKKSEKVAAQSEAAANYLTEGRASYTVESAVDYLNLTKSGKDMLKFDEGFFNSVKANLDANGGKLIVYGSESITSYAAVIQILYALDMDPENFYGYNLNAAFTAMDPTLSLSNPYYYKVVIPATTLIDNAEDFGKKLCDNFIENYYKMGSGMDYYGFACDNTANFIAAVSSYADDYSDILKDAFTILESYKVDGGYCYNPEYGSEPNCNSTALALMAYSEYVINADDGEKYLEKTHQIYANLCTFENPNKTGVFTYDGEDSALSTSDALWGINSYFRVALVQDIIDDDSKDDNNNSSESTTSAAATTKPAQSAKTQTTKKTNTSKKSPATGINETGVCVTISLLAAASATALLKKKSK